VALITGGPVIDLPNTRYVLKKPFDLDDLLSIVNGAVLDADARHRDSLVA
jgi:hypothetical protein